MYLCMCMCVCMYVCMYMHSLVITIGECVSVI